MRETAQALAGGAPSVVSVFAGRIADTGRDPVPLMQRGARRSAAAADRKIELLWASPRELLNIIQAAEVGCDIITVTPTCSRSWSWSARISASSASRRCRCSTATPQAAGYKL